MCAAPLNSATLPGLEPDIQELLRAKGCSLCTADSDEQPAGGIISTAAWGYLRLRRTDYTEADLAKWQESILAQNWKQAFVFFKHEEKARGPEMAMHFQSLPVSGKKSPNRR